MSLSNYIQHVWYASYGSNLLRERFLCYIIGGTPEGAKRNNTGSTDKTLPLEDRPISIQHPLYFAERSESWQDAGVAFISEERTDQAATLGRMYLITAEQFIQVVRQENGLEPDDDSLNFDILPYTEGEEETQEEFIIGTGWYGKVMILGRQDGYPIYTFTSPTSIHDRVPISPGENYLRTIGRGIHETYGFDQEQIADYFLEKPGVKGFWTKDQLLEQLKLS
jgi:hypothetical protein